MGTVRTGRIPTALTARAGALDFLAAMVIALAVVACSGGAAPTLTTAPAKPAATTAPAAPAPAATKPAELSKPAASALATAALAAVAPSKPANWPTRSIQLIVPWAAGGGTDAAFRMLAPLMEKQLGQPIEIVNKAGAGSQLGLTELARAKPDGYVIGNVSAPHLQAIYLDPDRKASFKWDDFAPIGLHVMDAGAISVRKDSKYNSLKDLLDDAKANPEKVKACTTGILGDDHLAILDMQRKTGVKFAIVHFDGGATATTALIGGHIDCSFGNVGDFFRNRDQLRTLAVLDSKQNQIMPDVPTADEQGHKVYSSASRGLAAPKGTPKEIVDYISYAMEQAIKDPGLTKKMTEQGVIQQYMNAAEFDKYMRDFEAQVKPLVDSAKKEEK